MLEGSEVTTWREKKKRCLWAGLDNLRCPSDIISLLVFAQGADPPCVLDSKPQLLRFFSIMKTEELSKKKKKRTNCAIPNGSFTLYRYWSPLSLKILNFSGSLPRCSLNNLTLVVHFHIFTIIHYNPILLPLLSPGEIHIRGCPHPICHRTQRGTDLAPLTKLQVIGLIWRFP